MSNAVIDIADLPSLLHLSLRDGTKLPDGIGCITSLQTLQYFDLGNSTEENVRSLGKLINLHDLHLTCTEARSYEHLKRNLAALSSSLGRLANLRSLSLAPGIVGMTIFVDPSVMLSVPIFLQRLELSSPICTFSVFPEWIAKLQKLHTLKITVRVLLQNDIDTLTGLPVLTSLSLFVRQPRSESVVFHSGALPVLKYFKYRCGALCLVIKDKALPNLQRLELGFNVHRGKKYDNMISGIEYLFNLKEVAVKIGAAPGADESDRRVAEIAVKDAIHKHPRFYDFLNIERGDWIEEDEIHVYKQDDGYTWRRYGVQQGKSSENYYKCTYWGCPEKKVVRSLADGRITEIIYKGKHNHPKPLFAGNIVAQDHHTVSTGVAGCGPKHSGAKPQTSCVTFSDGNADNSGLIFVGDIAAQDHHTVFRAAAGCELEHSSAKPETSCVTFDDNDADHSTSYLSDDDEPDAKRRKEDAYSEDSLAGVGAGGKTVREPWLVAQTLSDGDEPGTKRWKNDAENEGSSAGTGGKTVREPRKVVRTPGDVVFDDGFRWRKYGQMQVMGDLYPRSYYKCARLGCPVRKHIQRPSDNRHIVITTYYGDHNHDAPFFRGASTLSPTTPAPGTGT